MSRREVHRPIAPSIRRRGAPLNPELSTVRFLEIQSVLLTFGLELCTLLTLAALGLRVILHAGPR
jgi:hypothetical protein